MIKAVIFDFFGVLVGDGFDSTYRKAGGDPEKDRQFVQTLLDQVNRGAITTEEFRRSICQQLGITIEDYQEAMKKAEPLNYELLDYIKGLRGKYKTAILSNVNKDGLERKIDQATLDEHFDVLVVSGEVGFIKPEPEIYHLTAERLGIKPEECVFIDDRAGYAEAAEAVGMKAINYQSFPQMKKDLEKLLTTVADK